MLTRLQFLTLAALLAGALHCHPDPEPTLQRLPDAVPPAQQCRAGFDDCLIHPLSQGCCTSGALTLDAIVVSPEEIRIYGSLPLVHAYQLRLNNTCEVPAEWLAAQVAHPDGSLSVPCDGLFYWECFVQGVDSSGASLWDADLSYACAGAP